MVASSIVIICDDEILGKAIRVKLSSLREVDSIKIAPYKDAIFEIESNVPDVIIVFGDFKDGGDFGIISNIKATAEYINAPILLVTEELSEDFIVNGFDAGVDDFVSIKNSDGEFLTRVISCMKKNELLREIDAKNILLSELNVLQKESGFYLKDYSKKVFESEIQSLQKYGKSAVLMIISADINCKTQLTPAILGPIIKSCTRNRDKIGFYAEDKFFVLLSSTNSRGAIAVYERIKSALNEEYSISIGACEIDSLSFDEVEKNVVKSVNEALELGNTIVVYDSKEAAEPMNWLDNENVGQKNFKFFQAAFLKKLENVIAPVFYQMQKIWEERLFNTTIEQSSDENQSLFILKSGEYEGILKITYPGFAKINIDVSNNFENVLPKERLSLDLNELDDTKLSEILLSFIKEFQGYLKNLGC